MTRSTFLAMSAFLALTGCAQKMPLISHAHIGHSLTAWHDTPENEPLLIVAEKELATALVEIEAAAAAAQNTEKLQRLRNVVHALNPDREPSGSGLGYGAIRAAEGTLDHLQFAASSADASDNLVRSVAAMSLAGERLLVHLRAAERSAALALEGSASAVPSRVEDVRRQLALAALGDNPSEPGGLDGIRAEMEAMLARETDPRYEPLPRRYVLGLVRLPNGRWGYRLPRRETSLRSVGYGSYGY